jgi:hypothetical protein
MTMDPRQATAWSARDHGANFIDLAGPSEPSAPKEEEDGDDWSFGTSSDNGDDNNNSTSAPLTHATARFFL